MSLVELLLPALQLLSLSLGSNMARKKNSRQNYSPGVKNDVRKYYVFEQMPLTQVAAMKGMPPVATLYRWKREALEKGDDWDKVRNAHLVAGKGADNVASIGLTSLMILLKSTIDRVNATDEEGNPLLDPLDATKAIASLTDSLHKVTAASRRMLPEVSELVVAMNVIQDFGQFLQDKHKDLLPAFVDVLTDFGYEIQQKYGNK